MEPSAARLFFRVRVAVLLAVLAGVLVYAWRDVTSRRARNDWTRTLDVALVVVERGIVDARAIAALRARVPALEARMTEEWRRYRGAGRAPFAIHMVGPVGAPPPPPAPDDDGVLDAVRASWALGGWTRDIDAKAGLDASRFDARIYVAVRRPTSDARTMVEGRGEQGGRVGLVDVELDETMADLTLIVCAHELLHTLGASDEYDAAGRAKVPDGLAEPELGAHQNFAEIMARNRPVGDGREVTADTLDEVAVGRATAAEIGW